MQKEIATRKQIAVGFIKTIDLARLASIT